MRNQSENHAPQQDKLPVRRSGASNPAPSRSTNIWTVCPHCYNLYEYPKVYVGCCLRCQSCERAFQAVAIETLPSTVPGKDAYYCCWGFFPMGFSTKEGENGTGNMPNSMLSMFPTSSNAVPNGSTPMGAGDGFYQILQPNSIHTAVPTNAIPTPKRSPVVRSTGTGKKRGRPRKIQP